MKLVKLIKAEESPIADLLVNKGWEMFLEHYVVDEGPIYITAITNNLVETVVDTVTVAGYDDEVLVCGTNHANAYVMPDGTVWMEADWISATFAI